MLDQNLFVNFILRKNIKHKDGKSPIYLRVTLDGDTFEKSLNRSTSSKHWNKDTKRVKSSDKQSDVINEYLDIIRSKVLKSYNQLLLETDHVTLHKLKHRVLGKGASRKLLDLYQEHNERIEERVGVEYVKATYQKYEVIKRYTADFIKDKYDQNDIYCNDIDLEFIEDFELFLKKEKSLSHNTALKYVKFLKKIILIAKRKGFLTSDPFSDYKAKYKKKVPTHLTLKELKRIEEKSFDGIDRLEKVRDCFLFCCYTGLSYKDADKLDYDDFHEDEDGDVWLVQNRTKTDEQARILLLPKALDIFEKYRDFKQIGSDKVIPTISNQRTNSYLKEIADVCRIKKNLTFHVARHTFATTITLGQGLPIESVQIMMGHSDRRSTEHYARVTNRKLVSDMKKLKKKFEK